MDEGHDERRGPPEAGLLLRPSLVAALAGCATLLSCGSPAPGWPDAPIVVVSIDTLRSDRLPSYGYGGVATPALDALARGSIRFERAYTHAPLTLPAHASLFTGALPAEHGVRDNLGYALDPKKTPTLARRLQERGYATGAFVSSFVLRGASGIADGFDVYDDAIEAGTNPGESQRSGFETLRQADRWLATVKGRPFFLFVHLYEPHAPYAPPDPFRERYAAHPYDGEVATADAIVGGLFDALRREGAWDRAIVVVLSDHGEGLGEHGEDEHGLFVYRTTLQVPLFVKLPAGERGGTTDAVPAGLAEIAPTLLAAVAGGEGRTLLDPGRPAVPVFSETAYPRLHFGWSDLASAIDGRRHWIEAPRPELYDLEADPGESNDLAARESGGTLASFARERRVVPEPPSPLDAEARAKLASLGYLGGASAPGEGDDLPDPKDRVADANALRLGMRTLAEGDPAGAAKVLEPVLARNPRLTDGWESLARARDALGDVEGAVEAWDRALSGSGGDPVFALGAATTMLRAGKLAEAEALARVAVDAKLAGATEVLARAALLGGNVAEAERLAQAAVAEQPDRFPPRILYAQVLLARHRPKEALEEITRIVAAFRARTQQDPSLLRGAALVRGRALAALGDPQNAIAAYRAEIGMFPDQAAAYGDLAVMLAMAGDPQAARATIARLQEVVPRPVFEAEVRRVQAMLQRPR
ncbi:MAG TPA: sulfatase-like hydrolase/transferase [Candidatus Polarisedimenticolaceae bacterium]